MTPLSYMNGVASMMGELRMENQDMHTVPTYTTSDEPFSMQATVLMLYVTIPGSNGNNT